jgi:carboxymethylenebutenolidase
MKTVQIPVVEKRLKLESSFAAETLPHAAFSVYEVRPQDESTVRGGLILAQEIFGVNEHIRSVARHYAELGYAVWAPAYFDHIEPGVELGYTPRDMATARPIVQRLGWEVPLEDSRIAAEALKATLPPTHRHVGLIGYCWGGSLAWLTACRLNETFTAAVSYYGRQALDHMKEIPKIPLVMHFGKQDAHIPVDQVAELAKAHPEVPVYYYDAGHGFNCDARADYNAEAAALAEKRTLELLEKNLI